MMKERIKFFVNNYVERRERGVSKRGKERETHFINPLTASSNTAIDWIILVKMKP